MSTPAYRSNSCPHCENELAAEANTLFGDTQCPACDKKLWYLSAANEARFFDYEMSADHRNTTYSFVAERFEVDVSRLQDNPKILDELDIDSLEALEMLMDLEEELGLV